VSRNLTEGVEDPAAGSREVMGHLIMVSGQILLLFYLSYDFSICKKHLKNTVE
jgi:hypothetical protein